MDLRIRLWMLLFVVVAILPAAAMAQGDGVAPLGAMGWLLLVGGVLLGLVASPLGAAIVKLIPGTVDDDIRDWIIKNRGAIESAVGKVKRWDDPNDPDVPTGPARTPVPADSPRREPGG